MARIKSEYSCSLQLTFDLLGGKWKLRILWHILQGHNRFSLLRKNIPEITQKMLTSQLHELEESKLIKRTVIREKPIHVQYTLSDSYADLTSLLASLCDFSKDYAEKNALVIRD